MKHDDRLSEAAKREAVNRGSRTNRSIEGDADYLGVAGEDAWMMWCQVHGFDHGPRPQRRHKGVQFVTNGQSVKILCSRTPGNLLVKQGAVRADLYVLAAFDDASRKATLIGWVPKRVVELAVVRSLSRGEYSIPSHAVPVSALFDMSTLAQVLAGVLTLLEVSNAHAPVDPPKPTVDATQVGMADLLAQTTRRW